jgi:peptidoglycan/xylan/chitin deacetylase (PgdA/CDA1 family)
MIGPEHESLRPGTGDGFADSVTVAFGDPRAEVHGLVRIGLQPGEPATGSVLAVLFAGSETVDVAARGDVEVTEPGWESATVDAVTLATEEPLSEWGLRWEGRLDLRVSALSPPVETAIGGLEGYEQLCRVEGTATVDGAERGVSCLGQRGHNWGVADWDHMDLARTVCAWWDEDHALMLTAIRPAGADHHDSEEVAAHLLEGEPVAVADPRLSTTYDAEGHQRRAGLELYVTGEDDEYPRRVAGEVTCGTSLDLGRLRLDCAFFEWRTEGRAGTGRYDLLRRA